MNTTTFLAQLWGPTLLAVSLGVFISRKYYVRIYSELEKEALAVLLFAMVAITAGITQIHFHNVWGSFPEVVVSLLGWMLLLKGLALAIIPGIVDKGGDWQVSSKLLPLSGGAMLILGIYLCWVGYLI